MQLNEKIKNSLWVEKYRPNTVEDCILPERTKNFFRSIVKSGDVPNIILTGTPGVGKTTVAKAICKDIGVDVMVINGSDENGIDVLRTKIRSYAATISLKNKGKPKVVILDEAENLTANTQAALRNFMEEYSSNCRFILTCNYISKIIDPLKSRCSVVEFSNEEEDKKQLVLEFIKRMVFILNNEKVKHDTKVVTKIVLKNYPDFRKTIGEFQRLANLGDIDVGCLTSVKNVSVKELFEALKVKKFQEVRSWVVKNSTTDSNTIYKEVYKGILEYVSNETIPSAIITVHDYMYKGAFVADPEINMTACFLELMADCSFK